MTGVGTLTARCHLTVTVITVILALAQRVTVTVIAAIPVLPCSFGCLGPIAGVVGARKRMPIAAPQWHLGRAASSGGAWGSAPFQQGDPGANGGYRPRRGIIGEFGVTRKYAKPLPRTPTAVAGPSNMCAIAIPFPAQGQGMTIHVW